MSETERDRTPGVLDAVRDGWHSLGGGDAAACPGCPVCRLSESAARMDPETAAHLQQAAGHLVAAGRELLAAFTRPGRPATGTGPTTAGAPTTSTSGPGDEAGDRLPDPPAASAPARTRIPVHTPPTRPHRGNEEQQ